MSETSLSIFVGIGGASSPLDATSNEKTPSCLYVFCFMKITSRLFDMFREEVEEENEELPF